MKGTIKFTEDSPYYQSGEKEREILDLVEVHYSYESPLKEKSTAFEGRDTGFTIKNSWIKEFEIKTLEDTPLDKPLTDN